MVNMFSVTLKKLENSKQVKAIVSVTVMSEQGEFTINGFKVIHQDGKEPWVAMPENRWHDSKGEFRNYQIVEAGKRFHRFITDIILKEYEAL